jgi:phenylacetate-CoA ligase
LRAETADADAGLKARLAETLHALTKLKGEVELVAPGALPNDGKVIADDRSYT